MANTRELDERWARRHLAKDGLGLRKSRTEDDAYRIYNLENNTLVYPSVPIPGQL
jgi:hypothetical protein